MFAVLGASPTAGAWFNVFAVLGEYFYHSNLRTPRWVGYILQRPEHHSIHHQLDVHGFNYGDLTWWDRLFGTFRETDGFAPQCGFPDAHERTWEACSLFEMNTERPCDKRGYVNCGDWTERSPHAKEAML